jgi:hypothetical protein
LLAFSANPLRATRVGWNTLLRRNSPLEPFFTKEWRPSEIELVKYFRVVVIAGR